MSKFKSPPIHRTPIYRVKAAYANMQARCENKNGKNPAYQNVELRMTFDEWKEWALPRYTKFIKDFPDQSPTVSRIGDVGHYEIGNIRIISFRDNLKEQKHPANFRTLVCPVCKKHFVKPAHRVDFKIKRGKTPCCSRSCGSKLQFMDS